MCLPGIYKLALTHKKLGITKELMATKILPFLMPLSIENGLTLNQFNALMGLIKEMVSRVEGEHRTKLEQLNSIQQESKYVWAMAVLALYYNYALDGNLCVWNLDDHYSVWHLVINLYATCEYFLMQHGWESYIFLDSIKKKNLLCLCSDFHGMQNCKRELISIHSTQVLARLNSFIFDILAGTVLKAA